MDLTRVLRRPKPGGAAQPVADAGRVVDQAYWLILGRAADEEGRRFYVDRLGRGETTVDEMCAELVRSDEFRSRLVPSSTAPEEPEPETEVDVRELLATLTVEELAESADDYYRKMGNPEYYLAKPLTTIDEAPDFLICFAEILAGLRPLPGMVVLDFGAGTCWTSRWLTQLGYEVIAVDVSQAALDLGRQLYECMPVVGDKPAPRFLHFDGRRVDLPDESVDRIFCFDSFHHVPNQAEVLHELARVLRPGGVAGFSEPGPRHSKTAQSQFEMKNYRVVENDIVMEHVWRLAQEAGFTGLELALFSAAPYLMSLEQYDAFLAQGRTMAPFCDHVREFAAGRRNFFLTKGERGVADSRDRQGLFGELRVDMDLQSLTGECHATNTGSNTWLTTGVSVGLVQVGVHLYDGAGALLDRDYARVPIPGPSVAPGATVAAAFTLPKPPPGAYRLELDLVSEHVCWFEINGCRPVTLEVVVP